ncbi:hypothetical protein QUB05_10175 [Microcoleus sp. F10-C6]|uniref:hypothetical protein n=1 Tax=unclassified Microcoleus TaxID=2642155 RepID=UPI002FD560D9
MSFECVSFEFEEGIAFIYSGLQGSEVRAIEFGERKGSADARCPMADAQEHLIYLRKAIASTNSPLPITNYPV